MASLFAMSDVGFSAQFPRHTMISRGHRPLSFHPSLIALDFPGYCVNKDLVIRYTSPSGFLATTVGYDISQHRPLREELAATYRTDAADYSRNGFKCLPWIFSLFSVANFFARLIIPAAVLDIGVTISVVAGHLVKFSALSS